MYTINITRATKKIPVNEIRDFIFENYYKQNEFSKANSCYSIKPLKKRYIAACKQISRKNT